MDEQTPVNETGAKTIVVENTSKSTLYALIIGINTYPNITPLRGAVNDANEMSNFLTSDLQVPLDHIINLRNESASRANIIKGFRDLRDDPRIKKGDPILIYYAGHGGSQQPSKTLKQAYGPSKIQVIFPHDYAVHPPGATEPINCIPDKTIGALLAGLSGAKGDNLTVIFDSCHSASATRNPFIPRQPRGAEISMEIPDNIDNDILSSRSTVPGGQTNVRSLSLPFHTNQSTHIHLAACGDEEKAWEDNGRGVFTEALLKNLRAHGVDKITYHNLIVSMPNLPSQSPHCYGIHTSRILFDARVQPRKLVFIPIKFENGSPILQAGAASGVAYKSVWELYDSPTEGSASLGKFLAQAPKVSTVKLEPEKDGQILSQPPNGQIYARQVGHGLGNELKVWFSPEAKFELFESPAADSGAVVPGSSEHEVGYVTHEDRDNADITVELSDSGTGKEVVFHLNDPRAEECGVATLKNRKPARRDEVEKVLFAAAKWHWHLHRTPETTRSHVTMEFVKLPQTAADEYDLEADDTVVSASAESYEIIDSTTGVVDLVVDPDVPYGFKINNSLNIRLYVSGFYFDPTNFAIEMLTGATHGSSGARTDAELPARGYSIIGRELGEPIYLEIDPDVKVELGYIKLFWSTDPLELNIDQLSPFENPEESTEPYRKMVSAQHLFRRDWGVALLALIQRAF
ncbi:hypothetical protein OPQ81_003618 [Rhizoctonia solani]|nr:hypothetical protein OPQ81_003618 [Rhizoctonia solani]